MQAIKAVYDGVNFKPKQAIPVSGQYEVVITFVEQISASSICDTQDQISADLKFWKEFDKLVADASDEVLSMDDFPRTKFNHHRHISMLNYVKRALLLEMMTFSLRRFAC